MASQVAEGLLSPRADITLVHRRVVRVCAAAAWLVAATFLIAWAFTGRQSLFLEAVGPLMAAGLTTTQIALKRENGGIALFGCAVVLVVMYAVLGTPEAMVPATLALVVLCAIGTLLINSRPVLIAGTIALLLFLTPQVWSLPVLEAIHLGLILSTAFVASAAVLLTIRQASAALDDRYETLFANSPTAVLEEDWSDALAYVRSEYTGKPDRILSFLLAYPEVVKRAVSRARVVRANQAALDLLEAESVDQVLGNRNASKASDSSVEAFAVALSHMYQGKKFFSQEWASRTLRNRPIWLQVKGVDTSVHEPATSVLVGMADVTHIKARQDAMVELVRAKDEFIARVSHELRTPLTAVLGLASEIVSTRPMSSEERDELMKLVAGQAEEMSYLVEDLLVASRAEMGTMVIDNVVVDLEVELQAATNALGMDIEDLPNSIPEATADPGRVRQILRNLLTNAQRYGGPNIRVQAGAGCDRVWLEVRDDGEGVPEEFAPAIFQPYSTAHKGVDGSVGLGLSVSRQLAELMGGSLGYRRDDTESIFRLELPIAESNETASSASHMADA